MPPKEEVRGGHQRRDAREIKSGTMTLETGASTVRSQRAQEF